MRSPLGIRYPAMLTATSAYILLPPKILIFFKLYKNRKYPRGGKTVNAVAPDAISQLDSVFKTFSRIDGKMY